MADKKGGHRHTDLSTNSMYIQKGENYTYDYLLTTYIADDAKKAKARREARAAADEIVRLA
jgi:hypothetical protein